MPSDKWNSTATNAMGQISSLFNVEMPHFHQLLQLQCLHHGSTKASLCSPFLSPPPWRWQFAFAASWLHGRLSNCVDCRSVQLGKLCFKHAAKLKTALETKCNDPFTFLLRLVDRGATCFNNWISVFPYSSKRRYFSCCSLWPSIRKYEAYWHMKFSLINGCSTNENNIHGHFFFWSDTYEFNNIIIVTSKS